MRGAWSAAEASEEGKSQGTISRVACNSVLCVEVDNRGTVTYGAVKLGSSTTTKTTTTTTSAEADDHQDHDDQDVDPERTG